MTSEKENKQKLESFFKEEYQSLKAFVGSRLRATADREPEDLIQDVALNLFSRIDRSSPINNVAGFVYRSIRNKIIDVLRKRDESQQANDDQEMKMLEFAELLYGKSDNSYTEDQREELKSKIMDLKTTYRDIILAVDFEGYSYKEISSETGIPEGTLMSHRHRAISKLHKQLKHIKTLNK